MVGVLGPFFFKKPRLLSHSSMSRPRRDPAVKREVVVKEEVEDEIDDGGESGNEAEVGGDDPVGVYETGYVRPSHRPVSGRW